MSTAPRPLALVTGASAGIGAAFARALAARGYDLVLTARRKDRLDALASELRTSYGASSHTLSSDLSTSTGATSLVTELDLLGLSIDLLVNNAGFGFQGEAIEMPIERALEMVDLNVRALTFLALSLGRKMAERGRGGIINVGSVQSFQPMPHYAVYGASKAYVLSFSNALGEELRPRGVKVLALCPGITESEFHAVIARKATTPAWMTGTAEDCVADALAAYDRGASTVVPRWNNKLTAQLHRLFPRSLLTRAVGAVIARSYEPM